MSMFRGRSALGVGALLISSLLVGCDGGDDPPEPVESASSASATTSTSPSEPTTTEVAEPLGPAEVVRAWVAALNSTLASGDASKTARFTTPQCWTCDEHVTPIVESIAQGGWHRGGRWRVIRARLADQSTSKTSVYAAIAAAAGMTLDERGGNPTEYDAEKFILDFRLEAVDGRWLISKIVYLS